MFIGRQRELKRLNQMYQSGRLEAAVIYGRRRVGKTTLISEFCKDKRTIFFAAQENSARQNLEELSEAVRAADAGELSEDGGRFSFQSFRDAFLRIAQMARSERLVLVIDEYPYLAQAERGISSLLQNFLDHQFKATQLFLILCGSSMSFMENQVLGYQSPLYGRRTAQFKILPFDYRETGEWFPEYSYEEKAIMYGVTGGVPLYLEQFSQTRTVRENILEQMFDRSAMLFEEPSNLLKQELREPSVYNSVITAIADGKSKLSEIAAETNMETGLCTKYIANLITLGIVRRETPVTNLQTKRPIYQLDDQFFRFWYTFIPRNMSAIVSGRIRTTYDAAVGEYLSDYMGLTFERMCRDYILYYDERLPFAVGAVGQWWGGHPQTHRQAQIDVVVTAADGGCGIVGSCKFKNRLVSEEELNLLEDYAKAMGAFTKNYYYLFSKSGFTELLKKRAGETGVRLVPLNEMYD